MLFNNAEQRCFIQELSKYLKMPEKEVAKDRLLPSLSLNLLSYCLSLSLNLLLR
jgi:hypothetical protein